MTPDLLALGAAACWAVGSILSVNPARHLGAFSFTRLRMLIVAVMLWSAVAVTGLWKAMTPTEFVLIAFSGFVGIFIGDTALFSTTNRLGPRRSGMLFSTHALMSAVIGFVIFDERMGMQASAGAILTVSGVMIAILYGRRRTDDHAWEANDGHYGTGIGLGLLAALCHAMGAMIAKPVMVAGNMDPILASAIRVTVGCSGHFLIYWSGVKVVRPKQPLTAKMFLLTGASGLLGMALGMTFLLLALRYGDLGMVAILSSVTPILLLPLLWIFLRRPPARGAWVGAFLSVLGTALILTR